LNILTQIINWLTYSLNL